LSILGYCFTGSYCYGRYSVDAVLTNIEDLMDGNLLYIVGLAVGVYFLVLAILVSSVILHFVILYADLVYEKVTGRSTTVLVKLADNLAPWNWGGVLGKIINFIRIFDLFS